MTSPLLHAIHRTYGPRCQHSWTENPDCPVCAVWAEYDALRAGGGERRGQHFHIEHDGFGGAVIGHYTTLENKPGVVMQLDGARSEMDRKDLEQIDATIAKAGGIS